jgi:dihydroflavonol-4-reductase
MQTVGIIGGSGFIGSYVTKFFLKHGYKVKVSSTDIGNKGKYEHLHAFDNAANLTICALDLMQADSIKDFVSGCSIVVHGGTPFILDVKDPQTQLFEPTVKGTQNFLEVIKDTSGIEKVVFIASVAAWNTSFPLNPATYSADHVFSENDTPYYGDADHPYAQAKFLADQAVRKFTDDNTALPFEIVSISPVFVTGKALSGREDSTSMGLQYLFKNQIKPNPFVEFLFTADVPFALVDVRDVAKAIFKAATTEGIHGKNYLLSAETYKVSDISLMLNQQAPLSEAVIVYDNTLAKTDLGISFIGAKETLSNC